jgi:hypothetical protein
VPRTVRNSERLLYLSVLIGIIVATLDFVILRQERSPPLVVGSAVGAAAGALALLCLLTWMSARRRKNWARWSLLVLCVLGLGILINGLGGTSVAAELLTVLQKITQFVALVFIFSGESDAWFAKRT